MKILFLFIFYLCNAQDKKENADVEIFFLNYVKAPRDATKYEIRFDKIIYKQYFSTDELRSKFYYTQKKLKGYEIFFPNDEYFQIKIKIQPCVGKENFCCEQRAICGSDEVLDNTVEKVPMEYEVNIESINAGGDVEIAWIVNGFLPVCVDVFDNNECGIFLEIHRPGNFEILYEKKVESTHTSGYKTEFLSTKSLCAGSYDLFFVFRMRGLKYLMYVKPFFVENPSCTCDTKILKVVESGYIHSCT